MKYKAKVCQKWMIYRGKGLGEVARFRVGKNGWASLQKQGWQHP